MKFRLDGLIRSLRQGEKMKTLNQLVHFLIPLLLLVGAGVPPSFGQQGKLVIHATPKQAYIFVDDHAISEASKHSKLTLSAGEHKIQLVNYGYEGATRTVTITAGKTATLDINLSPIPGIVSKPFGAMTIEGANHDAILLNGKTPISSSDTETNSTTSFGGSRNWWSRPAHTRLRSCTEIKRFGQDRLWLLPTSV
jgi:hypothetical protein